MSNLYNPQSTTTLQPSTTSDPDNDGSWGHLLWIPYVVLTLILILLACISFMHYHFKNRGKYMGAVYKHDMTSCPRKYRVTLNRKGFVTGMLFSAHRNLINSRQVGATGTDVIKHDIFIVGGADCCVTDVGSVGGSTTTGSGSRTRINHNYENEAYDRESSQGSDKSLLNRNSDSLCRADVILDVESGASDVTDVGRKSAKSGFRMMGIRYKTRDPCPEASSGSEMLHDMKPSNGCQSHDVTQTTKNPCLRSSTNRKQKKTANQKTGSQTENHPKHITVTPLMENRES